jgi:ribose/xylose/arabinose/galactoside ABC-type transport system permease subunit
VEDRQASGKPVRGVARLWRSRFGRARLETSHTDLERVPLLQRLGLSRHIRLVGLLVALALIWAFFTLKSQYFLTVPNVYNILLQSSNIAIIAAGLTVVVLVAEIDLSIGSVEALTGSVAAVLIINIGLPTWPGVALALVVAASVGLINGVFSTRFGVVSFIVTLAMLGVAQGIAFLLTNGQPVAGFPEGYGHIGRATIGNGFPVPVLIAVGVIATLHVVLTRTRLGLHLYAVGSSTEAAAFSGINPRRLRMLAFVICSLASGIGGLILSSRLDAGNGLFGSSDLLMAVAAVVIGGTSLFGGIGGVIGTTIGVLMITTIGDGLVLLNVPDFWQQIVVGGFILGAMLIDQIAKKQVGWMPGVR